MFQACQAPHGIGAKYSEDLDLDDVSTVFNSCVNPDFLLDDDEPADDEEHEQACENLLGLSSYVQDLGSEGTVEAELACGPRLDGEVMAHSMPPCELEVDLPASWQPGELIRMSGPLGVFTVRPQGGTPGTLARLRLSPKPEFRIEVPPNTHYGKPITFKRADGAIVTVNVPQGAWPGDTFEVMPPALMVQVPKNVAPGGVVRFRMPSSNAEEAKRATYCRAIVPEGVVPGDYFAARIPMEVLG